MEQAREIGLVSEVLSPERLLERAQVLDATNRTNSPLNCQLSFYIFGLSAKKIKQELGEQWIREDRPRILRGGSTVEVRILILSKITSVKEN